MWTPDELKGRARFSLKAFYLKSVVVALILHLIVSGFNSGSSGSKGDADIKERIKDFFTGRFVGFYAFVVGLTAMMVVIGVVVSLLIKIMLLNPLEIGCKRYFLDASDGDASLSNIAFAFQNGYTNIAAAIFLRDISIVLWSLLLVIPGIIKMYEYRMIPYILAEDPYLTFTEARDRSSIMMQGEKMNAFLLDLSFIGWFILSGLTKGLVGTFFVNPYKEFTDAELYKTLCTKAD
ncbi:MAG: DUF975 family protein [bacterium]|nr:DUF975 family protein [bacterium]